MVDGLIIAVLVATFSPLASASPVGLEKVAEEEGFLALDKEPEYQIIPDYTIPFIGNEAVTTIFAVVVGTILVFGVMLLFCRTWTQEAGAGD